MPVSHEEWVNVFCLNGLGFFHGLPYLVLLHATPGSLSCPPYGIDKQSTHLLLYEWHHCRLHNCNSSFIHSKSPIIKIGWSCCHLWNRCEVPQNHISWPNTQPVCSIRPTFNKKCSYVTMNCNHPKATSLISSTVSLPFPQYSTIYHSLMLCTVKANHNTGSQKWPGTALSAAIYMNQIFLQKRSKSSHYYSFFAFPLFKIQWNMILDWKVKDLCMEDSNIRNRKSAWW